MGIEAMTLIPDLDLLRGLGVESPSYAIAAARVLQNCSCTTDEASNACLDSVESKALADSRVGRVAHHGNLRAITRKNGCDVESAHSLFVRAVTAMSRVESVLDGSLGCTPSDAIEALQFAEC